MPRKFAPLANEAVLRGGYGIYYSRATSSPFLQQFTAPPFAALTLNLPNVGGAGFDNPFRMPPSFPFFPSYSPTTSIGFQSVAQDYRPPITQQYSLNTQLIFARDYLLEVGYVGSRGTHQIAPRLPNQALSADASNPVRGHTTNTLANLALRLPFVGFSPTGIPARALDWRSCVRRWREWADARGPSVSAGAGQRSFSRFRDRKTVLTQGAKTHSVASFRVQPLGCIPRTDKLKLELLTSAALCAFA